MKFLPFLFLILLMSCSEAESEPCQTCTLIIESNQLEAQLKCGGLANNYPTFSETERISVGTICDATDRADALSRGQEQTFNYCTGVVGEIRSRLECN